MMIENVPIYNNVSGISNISVSTGTAALRGFMGCKDIKNMLNGEIFHPLSYHQCFTNLPM